MITFIHKGQAYKKDWILILVVDNIENAKGYV
jgi:hypothetical protein